VTHFFAIDVLFSDYPKCFDLISIYLPGLMISVKIVSGVERSGISDTIKMSEAAAGSYGDSMEQLHSFQLLIDIVL